MCSENSTGRRGALPACSHGPRPAHPAMEERLRGPWPGVRLPAQRLGPAVRATPSRPATGGGVRALDIALLERLIHRDVEDPGVPSACSRTVPTQKIDSATRLKKGMGHDDRGRRCCRRCCCCCCCCTPSSASTRWADVHGRTRLGCGGPDGEAGPAWKMPPPMTQVSLEPPPGSSSRPARLRGGRRVSGLRAGPRCSRHC